jgi:hypothetical protein
MQCTEIELALVHVSDCLDFLKSHNWHSYQWVTAT